MNISDLLQDNSNLIGQKLTIVTVADTRHEFENPLAFNVQNGTIGFYTLDNGTRTDYQFPASSILYSTIEEDVSGSDLYDELWGDIANA